MKKFIFNSLGVIFIASVMIFVLNSVYMNGYYVSALSLDKYNEEVPYNIEVANLGNSHGGTLDYSKIQNKVCYNFAMGGQNLSYDYLILKEYGDHFAKGATLFVEVSYFDFYHQVSEDESERLKAYYFILSSDNNPRYNKKDDFLYHYFPLLAIHPDQLVKVGKNVYDYYKSILFDGKKENEEVKEEYIDNADQRYEDHFRYYTKCQGIVDETEYSAFKDILEYAKANDINAVVITTPYTKQYGDRWDKEYKENFYSLVKAVTNQYGVTYVDFNEYDEFTKNNELYRDADHLNESGGTMLVNYLFKMFL